MDSLTEPKTQPKKICLKKDGKDYLLYLLQNTFKLGNFRPRQEAIIDSVMQGRDLLALLPTGSGKSLCYQLPAVASLGMSIIISPLLALINDQITYLTSIGINTKFFNSQTNKEEKKILWDDLASDPPLCKLLYTTPETLMNNTEFRSLLINLHKRKQLNRIILDEAHCVSNWGHEFRPSYLQLQKLKTIYPQIQIVAFTATATPKVQMDIIKQLNMKNVIVYKQSFIRHNLSYKILPKTRDNIVPQMAKLIKTQYKDQSGLIYCLSRQDCEDVSANLINLGIVSSHFHAGLTSKIKEDVQNKWLNGEIQVIVATIAFGLGINKPNVRFVFHHSIPKSIEGYYQETGRAGRDGRASDCILFYSVTDKRTLEHLIKHQSSEAPTNCFTLIDSVANFCENTIDCKKQQLSLYLGEYTSFSCYDKHKSDPIYQLCDNCLKKNDSKQSKLTDFSMYLDKFKTLIESQPRFNHDHLAKRMGTIFPLNQIDIVRLINKLIVEGYLNLQTSLTKTRDIVEYYQKTSLFPPLKLELETKAEKNIMSYFGVQK